MANTDRTNNSGPGIVAVLILAVMVSAAAPALAGSDEPAAPSATDGSDQDQVSDPLEPVNRVTSDFNRVFRTVIADPLVMGYQAITPDPLEHAITNFASNLTEPATAVSSLLQGDTSNAGHALGRFLVNITIGMGGVSDQAAALGVAQRREDLGQTAGAAGAGSGAHIVLPFFGPTNVRDITGDILTSLVNPLHPAISAVNAGTAYAENHDQLSTLTSTAIDPYIVERDAYEQNREYRINNGSATTSDIPDFDEDTNTTNPVEQPYTKGH